MKMLFIATMFAVASGGVLAEGAGSSSKGGSKFEKNGKPSQSWSQPFKPVAFGKNDKDSKNDDKYGKDKDDKHYGRDDDRGHGRPDWAHHIRDDDHKPWHHHHKPPISHC
jgi:hypothetical protein